MEGLIKETEHTTHAFTCHILQIPFTAELVQGVHVCLQKKQINQNTFITL